MKILMIIIFFIIFGNFAGVVYKDFEIKKIMAPINKDIKRNIFTIYVTWDDYDDDFIPVLQEDEIVEMLFEGENSLKYYYEKMLKQIIFSTDTNKNIYKYTNSNNIKNNIFYTKLNKGTFFDTKGSLDSIKFLEDALFNVVSEYNIDFNFFDKNNNKIIDKEELILVYIIQGFESDLVTNNNKIDKYSHRAITHIFENDFWDKFETKVESCFVVASHQIHKSKNQKYFFTKTQLGVLAHEFAHAAYNIQDLYWDDKKNNLSKYTLMADGMWGDYNKNLAGQNPTYLDAFSLINSGFVKPKLIYYNKKSRVLLKSHLDVYILKTKDKNKYFLLQMRKNDKYDQSLFDNDAQIKLLIYKLDKTNENIVELVYSFDLENFNQKHIKIFEDELVLTNIKYNKEYLYFNIKN